MSSSIESMPKGEEKKGNSENNPKDEMPKEDTTVESNWNGTKPKTSPMSEESKMQTEEKEQLTVLTMNVGTPKRVDENTANVKWTIENVIKQNNPDVVLFQEFSGKINNGKSWLTKKLPESYNHTGKFEASIMYNSTKSSSEEGPTIELQKILKELKENKKIPQEFAPFERMHLKVLKTQGVLDTPFICISWHGRHNKKSNDEKIKEFKYLMDFLQKIYETHHLPILIAGDFNVEKECIDKIVPDFFKIKEYNALPNQTEKRVIDYFIASKELNLSDQTPVNLKDVSKEHDTVVLDHCPIIAILKPNPPSDTAPPLKEVPVADAEINDLNDSIGQYHLSDKTPVHEKKDLQAEKKEEVLDQDTTKAMPEPVPLSDTAPTLDKVTVTNRETDNFSGSKELHLSSMTPVDQKKGLEADN